MISSVRTALTAIHAYGSKMSVTANNVANLETEDFKKSRATLVEGANNTVQVEITKIVTPGPKITEPNNDQHQPREMSNVDLSEEIPQTILTQRGYEANFVTLRAMDEMTATIIDIVG